MKSISVVVYAFVAVLVGYFLCRYVEYATYIGGIVLSFVLLNAGVLYHYQSYKNKSMALMKFMGFNFLKDIIWAVGWMFFIKNNAVLAVFIAGVFLLLSLPLYISVLKSVGNNQKSDKNQS